jgi:hypothetical protein
LLLLLFSFSLGIHICTFRLSSHFFMKFSHSKLSQGNEN